MCVFPFLMLVFQILSVVQTTLSNKDKQNELVKEKYLEL